MKFKTCKNQKYHIKALISEKSTQVDSHSTCLLLVVVLPDGALCWLCRVPDVLLSVEASAEALLVAGCGLHHAGANRHLHLPV